MIGATGLWEFLFLLLVMVVPLSIVGGAVAYIVRVARRGSLRVLTEASRRRELR